MKADISLITPGLPFSPQFWDCTFSYLQVQVQQEVQAHQQHPGVIPGTHQQLLNTAVTSSQAKLWCTYGAVWGQDYSPEVWKISTAVFFQSPFVHPVLDTSLEQFEAEAMSAAQLCVSIFSFQEAWIQPSLISAYNTLLSAVTHAWSLPERMWVFLFCPTYLWRWAEEVVGDYRGLDAVNWLRVKREPQSSHKIVSKTPAGQCHNLSWGVSGVSHQIWLQVHGPWDMEMKSMGQGVLNPTPKQFVTLQEQFILLQGNLKIVYWHLWGLENCF